MLVWIRHDAEGNPIPGVFPVEQDGPGEWVDESAVPPAPAVVPGTVTKYQCCVVLARHGLLAATNAFFAAMAADDPRRLAWEMAATVQRHSDSTLDAAGNLGLSAVQVDGMFIEAAQVE